MKDDRLYLIHVRECIERIEEYTRGGREAFINSSLVQDAVVRNLQVLDESTKRLSNATRDRAPDVNWRAIAGLRNILVHDYLRIDVDRVWRIVEKDLPSLRRSIVAILDPVD